MGKKGQSSWPPIRARKGPGRKKYWIVDLRGVSGGRETFTTKQDAQTRAEQARLARANEGTAAFSLSPAERVDASKALEILAGTGASLEASANHFKATVHAFKDAPTVSEIVKMMLAKAGERRRRERTVKDLRNRLGRFEKDFGDRQLSGITFEELENWLAKLDVSPQTTANYSTKVSQLYRFGIKRGWAALNLTDRIERPEVEDSDVGILSTGECERLLANANDFELLPYVVLGLFAGIRAAEIARLNWSKVRLPNDKRNGSIVIDKDVAKKRSRRVITIEPGDTLHCWLLACHPRTGPIVEHDNFRQRFDGLRKAAGIKHWPSNAMRHTFATAHLEMHDDENRTARVLGHTAGTLILHNHYKGLMEKDEAEKFWALRPAKAGRKVVPFPQTA